MMLKNSVFRVVSSGTGFLLRNKFDGRRLYGSLSFPDPMLNLSEDEQEFARVAHQFAQDRLLPSAPAWDEQEIFPKDALLEAAALGFGGIYVSEEHGGSGLNRLACALVCEAMSTADVSTTAYLSIHNMCAGMIDQYGTSAQRRHWLPDLCSMQKLASYCLTEPSAGSDAASLLTRAERQGNELVLNGGKAFISGGGETDVYLVMCRTDEAEGPKGISCVLVPGTAPGLSFGAKEKKLGWRTQPTRAVYFDNCRVPLDQAVLGAGGTGFKLAMKGLDGGRVNIAACTLGAAQACLEQVVDHVKVRKTFGRPLSQHQGVQFQLAELGTKLHTARCLVREAARLLDQQHPQAPVHCAAAKLTACDYGYQVVDGCLQLLGGYGYLNEYQIERYLRDVRVHRILEGTDNVMRIVISRAMLQ